MTTRERFIPYTRGRTFANPTAMDAFHYPTKADRPRNRLNNPKIETSDDSNCASEEDLERFKGFVFEPDRPMSSKIQKRICCQTINFRNRTGTK